MDEEATTVALLARQSFPVRKVMDSGMIFLGCQELNNEEESKSQQVLLSREHGDVPGQSARERSQASMAE